MAILIAVLAALGLTSGSFATELVLKNVHLVDPVTRTIAVGSIAIQDGKIESVTASPPPARITLDLSGKWRADP